MIFLPSSMEPGHYRQGFPGGTEVKNPPADAGDIRDVALISGFGRSTHSRILAWKIPRTEEPGRLSPWGCKESDKTDRLSTYRPLLSIPCYVSHFNPEALILYHHYNTSMSPKPLHHNQYIVHPQGVVTKLLLPFSISEGKNGLQGRQEQVNAFFGPNSGTSVATSPDWLMQHPYPISCSFGPFHYRTCNE